MSTRTFADPVLPITGSPGSPASPILPCWGGDHPVSHLSPDHPGGPHQARSWLGGVEITRFRMLLRCLPLRLQLQPFTLGQRSSPLPVPNSPDRHKRVPQPLLPLLAAASDHRGPRQTRCWFAGEEVTRSPDPLITRSCVHPPPLQLAFQSTYTKQPRPSLCSFVPSVVSHVFNPRKSVRSVSSAVGFCISNRPIQGGMPPPFDPI